MIQKGKIEKNSDEAGGRFCVGFTRAANAEQRTVKGVASSIHLDRQGEVILPSAYKGHLGKFLGGNAPFLAAHTHRSDDGTPTQIGWVISADLDRAALNTEFRFATTPPAEQWWQLASDPAGKGIAFSVGFIPEEWVLGTAAELAREYPELKGPLSEAGVAATDRLRVYTQVELLEISAVPVPANRESLQQLQARAGKLFGTEEPGGDEERNPRHRRGGALDVDAVERLMKTLLHESEERILSNLQEQLDVLQIAHNMATAPDDAPDADGEDDLASRDGRDRPGGGGVSHPDQVRRAGAALAAAATREP